jgi:hypothetical protein
MFGLAKLVNGQNLGFENLGAKLYERENRIASPITRLSY